MDNPFSVGQAVLCISEYFPLYRTTEADKSMIGTIPPTHPKSGEILEIDEMMGPFLRFSKYDCDDKSDPDYSFRWWHFSRFSELSEKQKEARVERLVKESVRPEWIPKSYVNG